MFIICFKIPVCQLGSVFSNNCVTSVTSNFPFLHRFCLFAVVCCLFLFYVVLFCFFTWSWKLCWLNTFFFSLRLCVELWQTLNSLVHKSELFKVVLTRFVGAVWAHPWLQTEFVFLVGVWLPSVYIELLGASARTLRCGWPELSYLPNLCGLWVLFRLFFFGSSWPSFNTQRGLM